jgi:2-keto-4-pentenoate hydratase
MTDITTLEHAASLLRDAASRKAAIEPLTNSFPGLTVADAWRIQSINRELATSNGAALTGFKCGLTSLAMQEQMGVDEPDYGVLLAHMAVPDGGVIRLTDFVQPRIEAEIALLLGTDLGEECTPTEVLRAVAAAVPALEIIDSRIKDWRLTLIDTIADNASSGAYVLGAAGSAGVDPKLVEVTVDINGAQCARGRGSDALGDPLAAAAWLARKLSEFGETLRAGSVILTGSLHASLPLRPGDSVHASFGAFGDVTVAVSET